MTPLLREMLIGHWLFLLLIVLSATIRADGPNTLSSELHSKGWIAFSAQTAQGDWDLFLIRPNGSDRHPLTTTPDYNEAGVRFSPDGMRILYYRMSRTNAVDNNTYGTYDLVLADSNGKNQILFGSNFPWACWGPDARQIACLLPSGIQILDVATRKIIRILPRQGIVQQLTWSPDGKSFVGTANGLGQFWNIGRLPAVQGKIMAVSEIDRYNCTADWCPDSHHIVYARGIIPKHPGRAELWLASDDGHEKEMLYAEEARHIYGACPSPDGEYLLFTRSVEDLGAVGKSQTTLAIIRRSETPMLGDNSPALHAQYPNAKRTNRLDLGPGWEPHWTYSETPAEDKAIKQ
jgi:dipeptidyl aminopeptidase/acylaminoacyl peptidase